MDTKIDSAKDEHHEHINTQLINEHRLVYSTLSTSKHSQGNVLKNREWNKDEKNKVIKAESVTETNQSFHSIYRALPNTTSTSSNSLSLLGFVTTVLSFFGLKRKNKNG